MAAELHLMSTPDTLDFDRLVRAHAARVYGFVHRLVGADLADDVCQDVWLAIYRALPGYRGEGKLTTWMLGIAHRVCGRKRRRRRLAADDEAALSELPDERAGPERRILDAELAKVVRAAIDMLPPGQREAVHLRQLEGCSYDEIAAILTVPVGTVRSRIHYGMMRLAELLAPYLESPHDP
ncbi:MAG: sigma-70 family RNA polymerase sigma factor, partial [Armatimonadetes bacterium]|nr:sigma-70 family RNA polymerase sigma factor [Armatimonadota bacterium]